MKKLKEKKIKKDCDKKVYDEDCYNCGNWTNDKPCPQPQPEKVSEVIHSKPSVSKNAKSDTKDQQELEDIMIDTSKCKNKKNSTDILKELRGEPKDQQEKWVKDFLDEYAVGNDRTTILGAKGSADRIIEFIKDLLAQEREQVIKLAQDWLRENVLDGEIATEKIKKYIKERFF